MLDILQKVRYNDMCAYCLCVHIFYFIKKEENHANF